MEKAHLHFMGFLDSLHSYKIWIWQKGVKIKKFFLVLLSLKSFLERPWRLNQNVQGHILKVFYWRSMTFEFWALICKITWLRTFLSTKMQIWENFKLEIKHISSTKNSRQDKERNMIILTFSSNHFLHLGVCFCYEQCS